MVGRLSNNGLGGCWRSRPRPNLRIFPRVCFKYLREITKNPSVRIVDLGVEILTWDLLNRRSSTFRVSGCLSHLKNVAGVGVYCYHVRPIPSIRSLNFLGTHCNMDYGVTSALSWHFSSILQLVRLTVQYLSSAIVPRCTWYHHGVQAEDNSFVWAAGYQPGDVVVNRWENQLLRFLRPHAVVVWTFHTHNPGCSALHM